MQRLSVQPTATVSIRDFGYPVSSPLHFGIYPMDSPTPSTFSDTENNVFPCQARALYDFDAEAPSELGFKEGDLLDVFERSAPGWLLATLGKKKGYIPENYVRIEQPTSSTIQYYTSDSNVSEKHSPQKATSSPISPKKAT